MKLKKKTSMMLVAASAVAVAGIAAVSFAAWTGSYKDTVSIANAQTGTINAFGFESQDTIAINETSNKLVPYDQPQTQVKEGAYILTANLPAYEVYAENYSINVVLSEAVDAKYTLYVVVADAAQTAPTSKTELEAGDWQAVTATEATTATFEYTNTTAQKLNGKVLSMILVSEGEAPSTAVTFNLNVNLVSASYNG